MNYVLISDGLWYTGHILTGISVFFSRNNAIFFICFGQFITIVSRPIGRINTSKKDIKENIIQEDKLEIIIV